jgi:pimeloyl-ACP methyl ester carboxylesterase
MAADNQTPQPQDIILSGLRMHFWRGGTGPGLLLLHAAWGDAEMSWRSVWKQLSRTFMVIAPDLPGFGQSSGLPRPSLSAMAQLLRQLLDVLNVDRVIAVGNSFGASVAIQFAADFPNTASQLVLVNGGYMPSVPGLARKLIALPLLNQGFRLLIRQLSFSSHALKRSFVDIPKLPPGFIEKIMQNVLEYSKITFDTTMNSTGPLAKPPVPTLLLWGAQDRLIPLKQAQALQHWIPRAELITIERAGHMPQVERPEEFVSSIIGLRC